jgi:alpha-beta hydrolase superfamily lysophospholipase
MNRGFTVFAMDLRGTGHSEGRRAYADSLEQFVSDVKTFIQFVVQRCPGQKIFLFGHSNGGKIVLKYAIHYPNHLFGIIASSPNIELCLPNIQLQRTLAPLGNRIIPKVAVPNSIKPEFTSHDPAQVEAYKNDPYIHKKITARLAYLLFRDDRKLLNEAPHFDHRCLLMHGGKDPYAR